MSLLDVWPHKFADRLLNSPAARWLQPEQFPLQVAGKPHVLGRRMTEVCALLGRAIKDGDDAAIFTPFQDARDLHALLVYLYLLRMAVLSGLSMSSHWANKDSLVAHRDIWVLCNPMRLRKSFQEDLQLEERAITKRMRFSWYSSRGGSGQMQNIGGPLLPGVCALSTEALLQGSLATALESTPAPYAVVIDATSIGEGAELAEQVSRLRALSQGAPLIVLGSIGDKSTIVQARKAKLPMWIMRGGDIKRLEVAEEQFCRDLLRRVGGADLASANLAELHIELQVLRSQSAQRLFVPFLQAAEQLTELAQEERLLLKRSRLLVHAVLGFSVPWRIHLESVASQNRPERYCTPSLEGRLRALREVRPATQDSSAALEQLVACTEQLFKVLQRPQCATPKQTALLRAAGEVQQGRTLYIIAANEVTQRAVEVFLGEHNIDVIQGAVRVMTRNELRRAAADGELAERAELLPIEPLGFDAGLLFCGIVPAIRLHAYDFERATIEKQLNYIAYDTQCTSAARGDKYSWVVGEEREFLDLELAEEPYQWDLHAAEVEEKGLLPEDLPDPGEFVPRDRDWLQQTFNAAEEEILSAAQIALLETPPSDKLRVQLEVDDGEPPVIVAADTLLPLLKNLEESGEGGVFAGEAQKDMLILLPRRNVGGDVLDRLLEQFEVSSNYVLARRFLRLYQNAVALLEKVFNGSAQDAYAKLAEHGLKITSWRTIQNWMRGMVLGPRDVESIRALGLVLERLELILHFARIHAAIAEIRAWRIALARKLIEFVMSGRSLGPDAIIDKRLRLRRADLEEFTRIGRIVKVTLISPQAPARAAAH
jgi:hypothetical protein